MEILKAIINIYLNIIKEIFGLSANKAKAELKKAKEKKEAQSFETSEENESNRENKLKKCKFPPKTSTTNLILNIFGCYFATIIYWGVDLYIKLTFLNKAYELQALSYLMPFIFLLLLLIALALIIILLPAMACDYAKHSKGQFEPKCYEPAPQDKLVRFYTTPAIAILAVIIIIFLANRLQF